MHDYENLKHEITESIQNNQKKYNTKNSLWGVFTYAFLTTGLFLTLPSANEENENHVIQKHRNEESITIESDTTQSDEEVVIYYYNPTNPVSLPPSMP